MPKTAIRIGPQDHGRRMSLDDFDLAEGQEGYLYELSGGVVTVMDVPSPRHMYQVVTSRDQLVAYKLVHPDQIRFIVGGSDCKLLLSQFGSERHPDLAVYKTPPRRGRDVWASWIPELVIEVVSPGSEHRDYVEKRAEYLAFGVKEYWILNADHHELLVLRRVRNRWVERVIRPPEVYRPRLFPGLEFDCGLVFQAASEAEE